MSVDRFNSREDMQFNRAAFEAGEEARIVHGCTYQDMMSNNPYLQGMAAENTWLDKSFRAGWASADADLLVSEEVKTNVQP
jgi:hypothetical protein